MSNNGKPKHFLLLKIIGIVALALVVIGAYLFITGFGDFESDNFMIGSLMATFGIMIALPCLIMGFSPEIAKMKTKTARYIQEENKEDLTKIASNTADIMGDATTKMAKSFREGVADYKYCKHCGAKIDADSKFCNKCGKEQ